MGSGKCAKLISPKTENEEKAHLVFFFFFGRGGEGVSSFFLVSGWGKKDLALFIEQKA